MRNPSRTAPRGARYVPADRLEPAVGTNAITAARATIERLTPRPQAIELAVPHPAPDLARQVLACRRASLAIILCQRPALAVRG